MNEAAILTQTVEQLETMNAALAALRREHLPGQPRTFAILAEGPLEENSASADRDRATDDRVGDRACRSNMKVRAGRCETTTSLIRTLKDLGVLARSELHSRLAP